MPSRRCSGVEWRIFTNSRNGLLAVRAGSLRTLMRQTKEQAMDEISDDARNYLSRIGRKGGSAKTPAKSEAAYKREAKHRAEREAAEGKKNAKGKA